MNQLVLGAVGQHRAEPVAADPADDVAGAQAAVEPLADRQQNAVGDLVAEGLVDQRHLVNADHQIGALDAIALAVVERVVERLAQPRSIVMAGQIVVVGVVVEPRVVALAVAHRA